MLTHSVAEPFWACLACKTWSTSLSCALLLMCSDNNMERLPFLWLRATLGHPQHTESFMHSQNKWWKVRISVSSPRKDINISLIVLISLNKKGAITPVHGIGKFMTTCWLELLNLKQAGEWLLVWGVSNACTCLGIWTVTLAFSFSKVMLAEKNTCRVRF